MQKMTDMLSVLLSKFIYPNDLYISEGVRQMMFEI